MTKQLSREEQISHIEEHLDAFHAHAGATSVEDYFWDYGGSHEDLYQGLCHDLGIKPRGQGGGWE